MMTAEDFDCMGTEFAEKARAALHKAETSSYYIPPSEMATDVAAYMASADIAWERARELRQIGAGEGKTE